MSTARYPLHEAALLHEHAALTIVHDWRSFLRARLTLLETAGEVADPFERDGGAEARRDAELGLAAIPAERRALFDRAVSVRREQRRAVVEADLLAESGGAGRVTDPDQLDRVVLRELVAEATEPDVSGHILFPESDEDGQLIWLEYRAAALEARPDAAAYRLTARSQSERDTRLRLAGGALALVLTALAIWMLLAPEEPALVSGARPILVNGQAAQTWQITGVVLEGEASATLEMGGAAGDEWPSDGRAHVRAARVLPLELCVPGSALRGAAGLQLLGDGVTPTREYRLGEPSDAPDVLVVACDDPAQSAAGTLQASQPASPPGVGQSLQLGRVRVTLTSVAVAGPAEDPAIPPEAARVTLRLAADAPVEWGGYVPMLRLGDGAQQMAPEVRAGPDGQTELRFLVTTLVDALPAELRVIDLASHQVVRWRIDLAPPLGRDALLSKHLRVDAVREAASGRVQVMVTNRGDVALALRAADLRLEWAGASLPLTDVVGLEAEVAAGESRALVVALPADFQGEATLSIGGWSCQVTR